MTSHKSPQNTPCPPSHENSDHSLEQNNQSVQDNPQQHQYDSDESDAASGDNDDEYITVDLADIRNEVQCPICLGILRKTRTVMECMHRFCKDCIDKSMRLGKNECPVCRTHCASRRSLRDDPNYDALISALYPDIEKYEEEELTFHDVERDRNKQIQDSIAETLGQQSEAYRSSRRRRNQRANEQQGSDEDDTNDHERGKDSSSAAEQVTEVKPRKYKRLEGSQFSQNSLAVGNGDRRDESDFEVNGDSSGAVAEIVGNHEMLAWGRGGIQSSTSHSSLSAGNGTNARNISLPKLIDGIRENVQNDELDIHLILVPLKEQTIPSLRCPHICCSPNVSIRHLCQYVSLKTDVGAEEVEILLVKELHSESDHTVSRTIDPCKGELHILEEHEKLSELQAMYDVNGQDLLFAYRKKVSASTNSA